jgi:hypothetical protein
MPVDPEEVFTLVQEGSAGRPHVAQAMVARRYVKACVKLTIPPGTGSPRTCRARAHAEDAVRLIRRAARSRLRPSRSGSTRRNDPSGYRRSHGIECYYGEHSPAETAGYLELCRAHGLVATGGSDFHGPKVRAATLGVPTVPMAAWEALKAKAALARASRPESHT